MLDEVSKPAHYQGDGIECMEAMESMMNALKDKQELPPTVSYWWGCAFKYLWRWPLKNGRQDLEKAVQCLIYLLNDIMICPYGEKELVDKELVEFVERVREAVLKKDDLTLFGEEYTHFEKVMDAEMYGSAMKAAVAIMRDQRDEALAECTDLYEKKELIETDIKSLKELVVGESIRADRFEEENAELEAELDELSFQHQSLQNECLSLKARIAELEE